MYEIGAARPFELRHLPAIERRAGALFRDHPQTADLPLYVTSPRDFEAAWRRRTLWVARHRHLGPVGFALVELLDPVPHLEELDVLPEHGRRGLGRALVQRVRDWARARGDAAVTLCTFREVPWNGPFYRRLGFRELADDQLTPALVARLAEEQRHGLRRDLRVAMRLDLELAGGPGPRHAL